jgi:hypothetical protein
MPFLTIPWANGVFETIDWPTILFRHATSRPSASRPALRLWTHRPIPAAAHVVLARPLHLDRRAPAKRFRDRDRLDDDIGASHSASAETAACARVPDNVDDSVLLRARSS